MVNGGNMLHHPYIQGGMENQGKMQFRKIGSCVSCGLVTRALGIRIKRNKNMDYVIEKLYHKKIKTFTTRIQNTYKTDGFFPPCLQKLKKVGFNRLT